MKPKSVDDGSLEKLAEKAQTTITNWLQADDDPFTDDENDKVLKVILSTLSEVTAALEEKIKQLEKDLGWTRDNATEHCRRADTAEAAVGENCRRIEELETAIRENKSSCAAMSDTDKIQPK